MKLEKVWHIFGQVIPLSLHGCVNQLWSVAFVTCQFSKSCSLNVEGKSHLSVLESIHSFVNSVNFTCT